MKLIGKTFFRAAVVLAALTSTPLLRAAGDSLRPPSVPLVACDPYFSIWSPADKLTDADTTHWTGKPHRLTSLVRIDGQAFRVMGREPADLPALPQTNLEVLPTRTIYSFAGAGVKLTLTFMTAALPEDIDLLSRPVTYVTYEFHKVKGSVPVLSYNAPANKPREVTGVPGGRAGAVRRVARSGRSRRRLKVIFPSLPLRPSRDLAFIYDGMRANQERIGSAQMES